METKKPFEDIAKLRKAIAPLLQELIPDGNLTVMAMSKQDYQSFMVSVRTDIATIAKAIEVMGDAIIESRPPEQITAAIDFSSVDSAIDRLIKATDYNSLRISNLEKGKLRVEGLEELRTILAKTLQNLITVNKKPTDPNNPKDYINVRLTDGEEFYNAIRRAMAAVTEGIAAYKDSNGNTVQVQLTSGGQVPVSFANTTLSVSGAVTSVSGTFYDNIANFPTIQTVAVQSMPAQTVVVNPTTSGSQNWVSVPFPNTTTVTQGTSPWTVSGTFSNTPGQSVAISGTVISTSGSLNAHIDNFPTIQTVQITGTVSTNPGTTTSGTNWSHVDNYPTTQSVTSTSGSFHSVVDNFPAVTTVVQGTSPWTTSGTFSNTPGQSIAVSGTVISSSGTLSAHIDNFPTIQSVTSVSGSLHAIIDNFPTTINISNETPSTITVTSGTSNINIGNFPSTNTVTQGTSPWTISGTVSNTPGQSIAISGAVIATSGALNSHIDNFPTVQTVNVMNMPPITVTGLTTSGSDHTLVDNFPTTMMVTSTSGSFHSLIDNYPTTQTVIQGTTPWTISGTVSNTPGQSIAVSGIVISTSGTLNAHIDNFPTNQSVISTSGILHAVVDNFPNILMEQRAWTLASGTDNTNITNYPTIQTVQFNPTQSVNISTMPNITSTSGNLNAHIDNYPTTTAVTQGTTPWTISGTVSNIPGQPIAVSGTINAVVAASGVNNVHVDNFPSTQGVFVNNIVPVTATSISGTFNAHIDNFPTVQTTQAIGTATISGANPFPTSDFGWSYRNLKTAVGSASTTGMTTLVSGITNRVAKVYAFSAITASTTAVIADFRGTDATLLWQTPMQAISATNFGSNATVTPPGYLFKSNSGAGIAINLSTAQSVTYNIAYWQDDSS